jgi:glycolate oxidase
MEADHKKAFADIIGPQWVRDTPCLMDTYALYMNPEILNKEGKLWLPRPAAVMMPETTQQVADILKLCNQMDYMAKPISTGFHCVAAASNEKVIVLDLKRMNKIVDIDVNNQIAVVEPYVKAINLQTILWKHGLNLHVISSGGNHSPLASVTSAWGTGLDGPSMSYSGRNLLGVEWVLPTGDIVTLGSAGEGTNAGWLTADGPGPSLRGIMRGYMGAFGGLGVFTKAAIKLYKWDGPKEFKVEGGCPHYQLAEPLPPNMGLFAVSFPAKQSLADAGYKMGECEITYADFRLPAFYTAMGTTDENLQLKKIWQAGVFQKVARYNMIVAIVGCSQREYDWKYQMFKEVLAETEGVILPMNQQPQPGQAELAGKFLKYIDDPLWLFRKFPSLQVLLRNIPGGGAQMKKAISELFWVLLRHANNTQGNFRPSQAMCTSLGTFDTWDLGLTQAEWIAERKQEYIRQGLFLDDGGDLSCGGTFEHCHLGYLEGIIMYSAKEPKSVMAAGKVIDEAVQACIDQSFGIPIAGFGTVMNAKLGPHCRNYHHWLAKIKKALDPNLASDPFFYSRHPADESGSGAPPSGDNS